MSKVSIPGRNELDLEQVAKSGLLPMRLSPTGSDGEELDEVLICASISGGACYNNDMPDDLTLVRKLKDGTTYTMKYVQEETEKN